MTTKLSSPRAVLPLQDFPRLQESSLGFRVQGLGFRFSKTIPQGHVKAERPRACSIIYIYMMRARANREQVIES